MKETTRKSLEKAEHFLSRVFLDRKKKTTNAVIDEQRSLNKECNGNVLPAYLYNYYISICQIPSWDLTNDAAIAKQLGLTARKVADTRRLLTKLNWIRLDTYKHNNVKYGMWYLGKELVLVKFGANTTLEEYVSLGIVTEEEAAHIKSMPSIEEIGDE